jgi:pimeloyl-ACP methyl ester carboxylesterase
MSTSSLTVSAPNLFIERNGRRLAYRRFGAGQTILFCNRFRGDLDTWDPAFLDALVGLGFEVIIFDYSGLGLSTGERTYNPLVLAKDVMDLLDTLELPQVVLGGWSIGGLVAQVVFATAPQRLSHLVLLGTNPPGELAKLAEQLFYDLASKLENDFDDYVQLFFEPASAASRQAAAESFARLALRQTERSVPVPGDWAGSLLTAAGGKPRSNFFPAPGILEALKHTSIPMLHIGGDHDISFPVENWYALNQQLPTLQLHTFPQAGHGPHQQYPEASAQYLATFVSTSITTVPLPQTAQNLATGS